MRVFFCLYSTCAIVKYRQKIIFFLVSPCTPHRQNILIITPHPKTQWVWNVSLCPSYRSCQATTSINSHLVQTPVSSYNLVRTVVHSTEREITVQFAKMPPAGTELGNWDKQEKCCAEFWVKMNNDEDKQSNCGDCCVTHGLGGLASLKSAPFTATSFT